MLKTKWNRGEMKLSRPLEISMKSRIISLGIQAAYDEIERLEELKEKVKDDEKLYKEVVYRIKNNEFMIRIAENWRREI